MREQKKSKIRTHNTCDRCKEKIAITLEYGPHRFCEKHFLYFFENRVKKTIRKYKMFRAHEKILVALSGGKDSVTLLHILAKYYSRLNRLEALIIDEGVKGYRDKSIKTAIDNCKALKVPYKVVSFKEEFGITNDKLMPLILNNPKMGGTCAFCGTMRRNIMNRYAKLLKADKLATGHNLDDEVQSFVMNVFNNDFERMKRMSANGGAVEHAGFVKRIKPLYETPEKEIIAYCAFKGLKTYSEECCPYSWTAKRNEYREMLNNFENRFPGTEYSIIRFYENLQKYVKPKSGERQKLALTLHECTKCQEPTERELCKTCEMIELAKKEIKNAKTGPKKKINSKNIQGEALPEKKYNKKLTCHSTKYGKTCE